MKPSILGERDKKICPACLQDTDELYEGLFPNQRFCFTCSLYFADSTTGKSVYKDPYIASLDTSPTVYLSTQRFVQALYRGLLSCDRKSIDRNWYRCLRAVADRDEMIRFESLLDYARFLALYISDTFSYNRRIIVQSILLQALERELTQRQRSIIESTIRVLRPDNASSFTGLI